MQVKNTLCIDLRNQGFSQRIRATQADANTRVVEVCLFDGGVVWAVPDGITAAVGYRKPDGTAGLYDKLPDGANAVTISGNTVTAILAPQVLTAPGIVSAVIILTDDSMRQLSTFPFQIYVEKNPAAGLVVSDNYINAVDAIGDLNTLVTDDKSSLVAAINEITRNNGGTISDEQIAQAVADYLAENPIDGGYSTTTEITDESTDEEVPTAAAVREYVGQHSGGDVDLEGYATEEWVQKGYQPKGDYLTKVPEGYAKTTDIPTKPEDIGALPNTYTPPNQTAEQVGADPKGTAATAVTQHNTADDSHNDIRMELKAVADRLSAFLDSDDVTLDQLSELIAGINSNKDLITAVTTGKVSVTDIINDLTTNVSNKPLSAAQGVLLKGLIDTLSNNLANYQPKGDYALRSELPNKVSAFTNDAGYLTEHQDISHLLPRTELPTAVEDALAQAKESGEFDGKDGVIDLQSAKVGQIARITAVDKNGVPTAWEAIDRTHYTDRVEVLPETVITELDKNNDYILDGNLNLIVGQKYTISWNGTTYICTAKAYSQSDSTLFVCLGNLSLLDSALEDTNDPFLIVDTVTNAVIYSKIAFSFIFKKITVSIYHNILRKLSNNYLDLEWLPTWRVILEEQTVENGRLGAIDAQYRVDGTPIIVYINGVPHETKIVVDGNECYANFATKISASIHGQVSMIFASEGTAIIGINLNGQSVKICLNEYEKIPEAYLPDNIVKTVNGTAPDKNGNVEITIPESGGGSGGSSVPADWDAAEGESGHVLNRTHYKTLVDMLPEQTIYYNEEGFHEGVYIGEPFVAGSLYLVTWGGVMYECRGVVFTGDGGDGEMISAVILGNADLMSGTGDSGEPFVAVCVEGLLQIMPLDGSTSQRVKIQKYGFHPMEREYLPKMCHVVKLPAMDNPPSFGDTGFVSITDPNGEIIQALIDHIPVYLDLSLVRGDAQNGYPFVQSVVIGFDSIWSEDMIRTAIQNGYASMVPIFMRAFETLNSCEWFINVNVVD